MASPAVLRIPVKYFVTILVVAIVGALVGGIYAGSRSVTYSANSILLVTPAAAKSGENLSQVSTYIFANMASYDALATTSQVLDAAAVELGGEVDLKELSARLAVEVPTGSSIITISSTKNDRGQAVDIANAVGNALRKSVVDLSPTLNDKKTIDVVVVQPAGDRVTANGRNVGGWILGGVVVGLIAGVLLTRLLFGPAPLAPRTTEVTSEQ